MAEQQKQTFRKVSEVPAEELAKMTKSEKERLQFDPKAYYKSSMSQKIAARKAIIAEYNPGFWRAQKAALELKELEELLNKLSE